MAIKKLTKVQKYNKAKRGVNKFANDYNRKRPSDVDLYFVIYFLRDEATRAQEKIIMNIFKKKTGDSLTSAMSEYL